MTTFIVVESITPQVAVALSADQGNSWESGGSRKADLGDFRPSKSDRGGGGLV